MKKMTIKELLGFVTDLSVSQRKFYDEYRKLTADESLKKFLATLLDQEAQYTEYISENAAKTDLKTDFSFTESDLVEFETEGSEVPETAGLSKIEFLRNAVRLQEFSRSVCEKLAGMAVTETGRQLFMELADEESRHIAIVRDRLELEELF